VGVRCQGQAPSQSVGWRIAAAPLALLGSQRLSPRVLRRRSLSPAAGRRPSAPGAEDAGESPASDRPGTAGTVIPCRGSAQARGPRTVTATASGRASASSIAGRFFSDASRRTLNARSRVANGVPCSSRRRHLPVPSVAANLLMAPGTKGLSRFWRFARPARRSDKIGRHRSRPTTFQDRPRCR
jgi:hypothetical protein